MPRDSYRDQDTEAASLTRRRPAWGPLPSSSRLRGVLIARRREARKDKVRRDRVSDAYVLEETRPGWQRGGVAKTPNFEYSANRKGQPNRLRGELSYLKNRWPGKEVALPKQKPARSLRQGAVMTPSTEKNRPAPNRLIVAHADAAYTSAVSRHF